MSKKFRQYFGILAALASYYIIHEGAHLLAALFMGVFKTINFMGIGIQIDVENTVMSNTQMGVFCLVGAVATAIAAYVLVGLRKKICRNGKKTFMAAMYYITIAMLLLDPLYLSAICGFVGGGDMNGIKLLVPEIAARIAFGVIFLINLAVFIKVVLPTYRQAFNNNNNNKNK